MINVSAAPIVAAHCDTDNYRSVDRHPAQPGIARDKLSYAVSIVALGNLQTFDSLPELKRGVVILGREFSGLNFAIDVVLVCFHLDRPDSNRTNVCPSI